MHTRLEVLLGLKLSGHTDTLTEASILIDELNRQGEIQIENQYRNAYIHTRSSFKKYVDNKFNDPSIKKAPIMLILMTKFPMMFVLLK